MENPGAACLPHSKRKQLKLIAARLMQADVSEQQRDALYHRR